MSCLNHLCCICLRNFFNNDFCLSNCLYCNDSVKFHNDCINNNSSTVQCFVCKSDSFYDSAHTHSSLYEIDPDSNFFNFVYPTLCSYYFNEFLTNMSQDRWNNSLSFYHVNARSLVSNFDSLNLSLEAISKDFTVIGITETWFTKNPTNSSMCNLNNYILHYSSRTNRGGGVALYVNKSLQIRPREDLSIFQENVVESLFIEVMLHRKTLIVGVVYCPKGITNESYNFLTNIFQALSNNNKDCVIMGDFNCNIIHKYDPSTHDFFSLTTSNSFHPLHYLPTRVNEKCASALDIIFTNITNMSCLQGIIIDDISDHFPIFAIFNKPFPDKITKTLSQVLCKRNFSMCNISKFLFLLHSELWEDVYNYDSPDVSYNNFIKCFLKNFNICFPKICFRPSTNGKKWITPAIKQACLTKNKLYKRYLRHRTDVHLQEYKIYRNRLTSVIRTAKKTYFNELFMHSNNSIQNTWQNINSLICNNNRYVNITELKKNDTHITNPKEISDVFNDFFVNVGFKSKDNIPTIPATHFSDFLPLPNPKSIFMHPITSEEILFLIGKLKNNSPGYDEIPAKVVKAVATLICEPLAFIFNNCISTGTVPIELKMAKVIPVFKGGNNLDVNNYRPISVLPVFSKILEKAIFNRLYNFFF